MSLIKDSVIGEFIYKFRYQHLAKLVLIPILLISFQNCSEGWKTLSIETPPLLNERHLSLTQQFGNGEGYGGKPDAVYAAVDALNKCGRATVESAPVLEQIEVHNGQKIKTVENCTQLAQPKEVPATAIEAQTTDGQLFVANGLVFQTADWIPTGYAPRDKYVDKFCLESVQVKEEVGIQKRAEFFMYKDKRTLAYDIPWNPEVGYGHVLYRQAHLRLLKLKVDDSQIIDEKNEYFELEELTVIDPATGLPSTTLGQDITNYVNALLGRAFSSAFGSFSNPQSENQKCWTQQATK